MIIPNERAFIGDKLVKQDSRSYTIQGHYGATLKQDGIAWEFYWGSKTKTYSKNRKWKKKLRYIRNKGLDSTSGAGMAFSTK